MLQIDNAEVELRNKLLNCKSTYAEIDTKYNTTKAERKAAKKQIKYAEKKIKNLETAKKKIQKNFQRNMNI
jgi:septal ring factor EnvC (AmiA/AmiB activator)